ncbi:hypothetical protein LTR03_014646 [Friedmanniomyces endolithicus]|nr:hypothetical protein LTR03_014646 [Friedmanniomyces endolithicus]
MALDQQRNWDISMAENLHHVLHRHNQSFPTLDDNATTPPPTTAPPWTSPPPYLPTEILLQILSHISALLPRTLAQNTLASCALLSHQWHAATLPLLYAHPRLYGQNFDPFVRAICPSINLHVRPSPLAKLVKSLNMASMVHQVSRTSTARLLGRTKEGLEEFVAPQASFAINCLPALGKCGSLRTLDLSLVSESPPLSDLFRTLERLGELRVLRLPRSAGFGVHHKATALDWKSSQEVEGLYVRALQGREEAWGPKHTPTFSTVNNLGNLYADQGRRKEAEAEAVYLRALQGHEKALGPKHPSTSNTITCFGNSYAEQGVVKVCGPPLIAAVPVSRADGGDRGICVDD